MLVLAALSWGGATVTSKYAVGGIGYTDLLAIELFVGLVLLTGYGAYTGHLRRTRRWRLYALLGLFEPALSFALFDAGLVHTGASDGALLVSLESVFAVLLAVVFLRERPGAGLFVALGLGFVGAVLVAAEGGSTHATLAGDLLVLGGALTAGAFSAMARGVAGHDHPVTVTAYQFAFASLFSLPLVLASHSQLGHADAGHIGAAVATGLIGSAVPFLLYNAAIASTAASRAAITLNLIPVFGVVFAFVLLGERPGLAQLAGGLLIVVALALTGGGDGEMEAGSAPAAVASRSVYGSNDGDPIGGI
jgi:drug/metabolite transporter (DMT)-like permease